MLCGLKKWVVAFGISNISYLCLISTPKKSHLYFQTLSWIHTRTQSIFSLLSCMHIFVFGWWAFPIDQYQNAISREWYRSMSWKKFNWKAGGFKGSNKFHENENKLTNKHKKAHLDISNLHLQAPYLIFFPLKNAKVQNHKSSFVKPSLRSLLNGKIELSGWQK